MKTIFLFLGLLSLQLSWCQNTDEPKNQNAIPNVVDNLYREDQFYVGLSFNLIANEPQDFSQNGFSGGLHLGFIRDMPLNKRRNFAIGVGLGLSFNTYNSNVVISQNSDNQTDFRIIEDIQNNADANRFSTNLVEVPIQIRWRTSTATTFSFWRIYSGVKFGYIYGFKSTFRDDDISIVERDVPELNRLRYHATLSIGNGSFNAFLNYSLNTLFDNNAVTQGGEQVALQPIKFGVEFYFL